MFPNNNPQFVDKLVHAKQEDIRREMEKACSLKQEHQASQTIDRKLTA